MKRSHLPEILDIHDFPEEVLLKVYKDLYLTNKFLLNLKKLNSLIREDENIRTVVDIGCANGLLVDWLQRKRKSKKLNVVGVDLKPPSNLKPGISIFKANAIHDPIPKCDLAYATYLIHHLTDEELIKMIRNVGKYAKRFVIIDPVRSKLPLWLYRIFVCPWVHAINREDGLQSVRRAFTKTELTKITEVALVGMNATFKQSVTFLNIKQVLDIRYE